MRQFLGRAFSDNSMLVLSHCDDKPASRVDQIIDDMKTHAMTREIIDYCKLGVFPYGTFSADRLQELESKKLNAKVRAERTKEEVEDVVKKIENMRTNVIQCLIKMANKSLPIANLGGIMTTLTEKHKMVIRAALERENNACTIS